MQKEYPELPLERHIELLVFIRLANIDDRARQYHQNTLSCVIRNSSYNKKKIENQDSAFRNKLAIECVRKLKPAHKEILLYLYKNGKPRVLVMGPFSTPETPFVYWDVRELKNFNLYPDVTVSLIKQQDETGVLSYCKNKTNLTKLGVLVRLELDRRRKELKKRKP